MMFPGGIFCGGPFPDFRIQVVAVSVLDFQKPTHVVDSGNQLLAAV